MEIVKREIRRRHREVMEITYIRPFWCIWIYVRYDTISTCFWRKTSIFLLLIAAEIVIITEVSFSFFRSGFLENRSSRNDMKLVYSMCVLEAQLLESNLWLPCTETIFSDNIEKSIENKTNPHKNNVLCHIKMSVVTMFYVTSFSLWHSLFRIYSITLFHSRRKRKGVCRK